MIITHQLSKHFDDFIAVNHINLNVEAGEVLGLLGPNGAGKTTTVRLLTSVLKPSHGWAKIAGFDVEKQANEVRASVGVLTEHHGVYNRMPAGEYLDFFGQLYKIEPTIRQKRIEEILHHFGIARSIHQPIGEFSKGMRQKLALARALIHNPPVLLLDEPTSAMDPESAKIVRDEIRKLRSDDRAIIICTHNLAEAEGLADKIAIIRDGKIIAQGSPKTLKQQFLGQAEYIIHFSKNQYLDKKKVELPKGAKLVRNGDDWLIYCTNDPAKVNPKVLETLISQGLQVISLHEVSQNLEQVYLQVINNHRDTEIPYDQ
jgi:ABC-2 type transport system ATP-binding protein